MVLILETFILVLMKSSTKIHVIQFRLKLDKFYYIGGYELTEKDFLNELSN